MTKEETTLILAVLKAAYPHSFKGLKYADGVAMLNLWHMQFQGELYPDVEAAVNSLIATRTVGYSPTVGEVKEKLLALRSANALGESEAWALVSRACRNGLYGYKEEFAKLPPEVQRAVGMPEQLREWAAMDVDTVQSVVASNFMRNYRARQAREKEQAMLPESVRQMIGGVADGMKMLPDPE